MDLEISYPKTHDKLSTYSATPFLSPFSSPFHVHDPRPAPACRLQQLQTGRGRTSATLTDLPYFFATGPVTEIDHVFVDVRGSDAGVRSDCDFYFDFRAASLEGGKYYYVYIYSFILEFK
jgi:hypothetical protein